uniref:RXYLT1 C-terminal domain-containing protein n=1 Tax=Haptolina brevifila TaxID=156173 RepID=A0A7S2CEC7_9EUKA|mmetsp:Transcript_23967/g.47913  ORF Transcript_23967/g.47913 Transcript_23967/m.47913 type:complete len:275 (+) Transcript_23967:952-1776(+)
MYADSAASAVAEYPSWRVAFRNNEFSDADGSHSLRDGRRRGVFEWYPLGVSAQWVRLGPREPTSGTLTPSVRASERQHFLTFLGSTDKSEREDRVAQVRVALQAAAGDHRSMLSTRGHHSCYGNECDNTEYVHAMRQSALSLHLPGSSADSGRLWEALEAGAVPVIVEEFGPGEEAVGTAILKGEAAVRATRDALTPLLDDLGAPLPFVVVRNTTALVEALRSLHEHPEALDVMQETTASWWASAKAHYARRFESAICSQSQRSKALSTSHDDR